MVLEPTGSGGRSTSISTSMNPLYAPNLLQFYTIIEDLVPRSFKKFQGFRQMLDLLARTALHRVCIGILVMGKKMKTTTLQYMTKES